MGPLAGVPLVRVVPATVVTSKNGPDVDVGLVDAVAGRMGDRGPEDSHAVVFDDCRRRIGRLVLGGPRFAFQPNGDRTLSGRCGSPSKCYQVHFCSELPLHVAMRSGAFSAVDAVARQSPLAAVGRIVASAPKCHVCAFVALQV